jgi:uncharacterized delta-60 repeat protein
MKKMILNIGLALAGCIAITVSVHAAAGDLDTTFGIGGKVTTQIGSRSSGGYSVALQPDGKIVVAGSALNDTGEDDFAVARYNVNGSLDTSFNGTGKVETSIRSGTDFGRSVAIQGNGKIVVAGESWNGVRYDFAVVRYNSDGSLDTTFGGNGKVVTALGYDSQPSSVVVQKDGKIVIGGYGTLGDVVSASGGFAVVRYNVNGTLDTSFNGTGKVITIIGTRGSFCQSLALQSDGKIVASGFTSILDGAKIAVKLAVVRYNANGSLDASFNGTGTFTYDFGYGQNFGQCVALQMDGKILVAGPAEIGTRTHFAVLRLTGNGSLDTSFNSTGTVTTAIGDGAAAAALAVASDGKIVVAGEAKRAIDDYDFAAVRYNSNGTVDTAFNGTGTVTTAVGSGLAFGTGVVLQSDGKIVVAGRSSYPNEVFSIVRYNVDPDPDADADGIPDIFESATNLYVSPTNTGTSPTNPDTDGDALNDGQEVNLYHTNPNVADSDGDGFLDGYEVLTGKSPLDIIDKPALVAAARTAIEFTFPSALGKSYRIEDSLDLTTWSTVESGIIGNGGQIQRFYSTRNLSKRYFRVEEDSP